MKFKTNGIIAGTKQTFVKKKYLKFIYINIEISDNIWHKYISVLLDLSGRDQLFVTSILINERKFF